MTHLTTSACGKIMIAGEYAVLFGGAALVMPSQQHAMCTFAPGDILQFSAHAGSTKVSDELFSAVVKTAERCGITVHSGSYHVDTRAFFHDSGQKLGLGSSAAATVALGKMLCLQNAITDRTALLDVSLQSHREFSQGLGSGADVAAAVYGEAIQFELAPMPIIRPVAPSFLNEIVIIATATAQNTREYVRQAFLLRNKARPFLRDFIEASTKNCRRMIEASTEEAFISAMHELYEWLLAFGAQAKIDVVSKDHAAIHRLARSYGGSAKPSGAGGGDIAIAFVPKVLRAEFLEALAKTSSLVL